MKIVGIHSENVVKGDVFQSADKVGWTDKRQENRGITKNKSGGWTEVRGDSGGNHPTSGDCINSENSLQMFLEITQKLRFGHFLNSVATVSILNSDAFHYFEHTK